MAFEVDAEYVRRKILPTLIGPGARYSGILDGDEILARVEQEALRLEQKLSTRFTLTEFRCFIGPGARPDSVPGSPAVPADGGNPAIPAVLPIEFEDAYPWPSLVPSDGFLAWTFCIRPVVQLVEGRLFIPGTTTPGLELKTDWFRLSPLKGECTLMPKYGASSLVIPSLPYGLTQFMAQRLPASMSWIYRAGMTDTEWRRYPQINRAVAIRAACSLLPILSTRINPSGATSSSADGLSVSRKSGYVFADLEERLLKEAEAIETQVLDAWDGTSHLGIL